MVLKVGYGENDSGELCAMVNDTPLVWSESAVAACDLLGVWAAALSDISGMSLDDVLESIGKRARSTTLKGGELDEHRVKGKPGQP